jgi:Protein of unknown function (DUF3159)
MGKTQTPAIQRPPESEPADAPLAPGRAALAALSRPGLVSGIVVTGAPGIAFVAADTISSLYPALAAACVTAVAGLGWRLARHHGLRQSLAGLAVVAACAAVAAVTGQERGFFLLPALIPFAVIAVCAGSVLAGRPLTGVILNRVSGGPADWRQVPRLRRVYVVSTLACAAVNVANAAVQAVFYLANQPAVLAIAHTATGPVFAVIVAVTVVFARRAMPREGRPTVSTPSRQPPGKHKTEAATVGAPPIVPG